MNYTENLLSDRFRYDARKKHVPEKLLESTIEELNNLIERSDDSMLIPHETCPLCDYDKATIIAQKDRYGLKHNTQVCDACGLVYASHYFSDFFIKDYYSKYASVFKLIDKSAEEWFIHRTNPEAYAWKRYRFIKEHLYDNYKKINMVIEIGASDGCNLYPFHLDGKKVLGCDLDERRVKVGCKHGLNLVSGDLDQLVEAGYHSGLIILSHIVEHIPLLDDFFVKIRKILVPEGFLYIEVPGLYGWNQPSKRKMCECGYESSNDFLGYLQFEHLYNFELETLELFVCRNGFKKLVGDQIIRSIFLLESVEIPGYSDKFRSRRRAQKIMTHLWQVEKDYQEQRRQDPPFARFIKRGYRYGRRLVSISLKSNS